MQLMMRADINACIPARRLRSPDAVQRAALRGVMRC
jgi:hypothetical protein